MSSPALVTFPGRPLFRVNDTNYKWWAGVVVMIGMFMAIIDNSIVNVALPHIMAAFGSNVEEIEWVATGYMLALAIMMPTTGWLGRRFGQKKLYFLAVAVFTLTSGLCGMSWDLDSLIVFRVLQGFAGGAIMPVGQALLYDAFPRRERGTAMALVGMGAMFAPIIGPTLGGYLTETLAWRSIFYVNLPVGMIGTMLAFTALRETDVTPHLKFDWWGFLTMAGFLSLVLIAVSKGNDKGWDSDYVLGRLAASAVFFSAFLVIELWRSGPVIELDLFRNRVYAAGTLTSIVQGLGLFGSIFLLPIFLQNLMGYDAIQTGLILIPQGVTVALTMPIAGRLVGSRLDPRILMVTGMGLLGTSLILQSDMGIDTSIWTLAWWQVLRGLGLALSFPAVTTITLSAVPRQQLGQASGLFNVSRQLGGTFGIALLATLMTRRQVYHLDHLGTAAALNGVAEQAIRNFTALLHGLGWVGPEGTQRAMAMAGAAFSRQAAVLAFDDAFFVAGIISLLGILPALFVTGSLHAEEGERSSPAVD